VIATGSARIQHCEDPNVPKPNYQFEKRQRELKKKRKKEEKRQKKLESSAKAEDSIEQTPSQD